VYSDAELVFRGRVIRPLSGACQGTLYRIAESAFGVASRVEGAGGIGGFGRKDWVGCSVAEVKNAGRMSFEAQDKPTLPLGPGGLSNEFEDGVGGAIDGSGGAEAGADFGEVGAHGFAG
jgi:hypothetical protein